MKVITGSPGTGKHTVAMVLAKKYHLDILDINRLAISEGIVEKNDGHLDVDVLRLAKILERRVGRETVLVGHLAPYVIPKGKVEVAVVLRRSPYSLEQVYKKRGYARKKAIENMGAEILGVTYYDTLKRLGKKKTFQFDTTGQSISSTTKRVLSLFAKGRAGEDEVDWLKTVTSKGDLKRFFPY